MTKERVLILCTGNSARSQMAEGLLRSTGGDKFEVESAVTVASFVRPQAIAAMAEIGIDITVIEQNVLMNFLERRSTTSSLYATTPIRRVRHSPVRLNAHTGASKIRQKWMGQKKKSWPHFVQYATSY